MKRPLEGLRVVITRQASKTREALASIAKLGGIPISVPSISIDRSGSFPEFDRALANIDNYDYVIVTSANTATALLDGLSASGRERAGRWKSVAIGKATARALEEGGIEVGIVPDEAVSTKIAASLGDVRGKRILIPGSDIARGEAAAELRALGAAVDVVVAYRTVGLELDPSVLGELKLGVDAIFFTSPSTVRNFDAMTQGSFRDGDVIVACIGPVSADAAFDLGYRVAIVAVDHSLEGLVQSLVEYVRDSIGRPAKGAIA